MAEYDLVATCTFGFEKLLVRELEGLGFEGVSVRSTGRVVFRGDDLAVAIANVHLRTAERVLIEVGRFEARDFDQLYDGVFGLDWGEWLDEDSKFPVNGRSVKSQLSSVPACQKIVKRAIVDKMRGEFGREWLDEDGESVVTVEVSLLEDVASVTLDTTGVGLHKRGYRKLTAGAPLRETLAAGLVMLSFWNPERLLLDPFCGSGTIAIEAAMIGRRIAPGVNREFEAEGWKFLDSRLWGQVRMDAEKRVLGALPERIMGTDVDGEVLSLARYHAEQMGVSGDIHFQQADFRELTSKRKFGCMVTNPPYGKRMSELRELEGLYRSIPLVLRKLPTWSFFILTGYEGFERLLGREADRRRKLYNAQIACTYFQFYGPRPGSHGERSDEEVDEVAEVGVGGVEGELEVEKEAKDKPRVARGEGQAFGGLTEKAYQQAEVFGNRLKKMGRHMRRWPTKRGVTCFRIYDRDVPEVPLVVDRYEDHLHLAEHERPHDRDVAGHADWLDLMTAKAGEVLGVEKGKVFMKSRGRQRGMDQYEKLGEDKYVIEVREGGLRFEVNLSDYVDTGLFLDHRVTRGMVRDEAEGKDFLNLFCYTGAFTVYAAAGGARSTTSVDLSNTYIHWAERNMALNGFEGEGHRYVRSDVMAFLDEERLKGSYDLAVVDPPTFSNSKKTDEVWDVQARHGELLEKVLGVMRKGGRVYFSNNYRRFKLDEGVLEGMGVEEISGKTVPEDFRNKRIHRCWVIEKA